VCYDLRSLPDLLLLLSLISFRDCVEHRTGKYDQSVSAATSTYRKEHMCGAPANAEGWRDPGLLHSAVLSNLRPGTSYPSRCAHSRADSLRVGARTDTRYYYVYGDPTFGFSAESSFVSEPHHSQSEREINLFAFGDMGKTTQVSVLTRSRASSSSLLIDSDTRTGQLHGALEQ
jgi:hypothetical protein